VAPRTWVIGIGVLVASALLTGVVRKAAIARGILDVPNRRSSHTTATPRGGGLAIVLAATVGLVSLAAGGLIGTNMLAVLIGGGLAVALVGLVDDRNAMPPGFRLLVHFLAAVWAVSWLGGVPAIALHHQTLQLGWMGVVVAVLGVVWVLNLFNFMDGIDGLATSEAVFIAGGAALLGGLVENPATVPVLELMFVAACCGFLLWNWPPAKIFLGDVGSGYLGYVIGVLALAATRESPAAPWMWLILGGVFFVDATVTLVRRALRGERIYEAHRSHGYQWLARRWGSHRRVTVAVMMVNLIWLLPCAFFVTLHPDHAVAIVVVALVPLVALAIAAGAGRRENANPKTAMT
jgi:Fuc2NAc and GlcNAc transferase